MLAPSKMRYLSINITKCIQCICKENYKILMKEIEELNNRYLKFINRRVNFVKMSNYSQIDLQIQCNPTHNPSRLFYGYRQTNSKVYIEKQKTQNSQHNIKIEKQRWRTNSIRLQRLLQSYTNQDSVALEKRVDKFISGKGQKTQK